LNVQAFRVEKITGIFVIINYCMKKTAILFVLIVLAAACNNDNKPSTVDNSGAIPAPAPMNYSVVKIYPHDTSSFTEGLFLLNNELYESTGLYKKSWLLKTNVETGKPTQKLKLNDAYFGEGISVVNNKIYQLTYQEHKVFVYDMNFKKLDQEFDWPFEGWGMTTDGKYLIIDTGGSNIYFVNPETFKIERTLGVMNNNGYVDKVNELEYADGYLYANIWLTNYIIKINPKTGIIEGRADLTDILAKNNQPAANDEGGACLNGIAYDSAKKTFLITGKLWPSLFEIKFN